jgi:hypothetical protein
LLTVTGLCLLVLWASGIPGNVFHFSGAKGQIDDPAFVATKYIKYTYRTQLVPPGATLKQRLLIYYFNVRERVWGSAALYYPSPVHAYSIETLLNYCTERSGKRYLIAREALGVVYFGHTNSLNAAQWVALAEQALRDHGLLLFSNRAGVVKVIPKAKLQDYRKAGLLKDTDGPGVYPFTLFCATGALWFVTWLYAHRLLHRFCARFPEVAQREIPYAFDRSCAHPEKAIFFFRRRAAEVIRADPALWRERRRFIALSLLSVVFPLLWFLPLFVFAVIMSQK